jgi:putative oxidoreductase
MGDVTASQDRTTAMENYLAPYRPVLLSIFRIMAGLLILQFGTAKILGFPAVASFAGVTAGQWPSWYAGMLELVFGALLTIGLFSRIAAFILSGLMAFAYFIAHAPGDVFSPLANEGTLAILFCFSFLYLAAAGPGPWSADAAIRGRQ